MKLYIESSDDENEENEEDGAVLPDIEV